MSQASVMVVEDERIAALGIRTQLQSMGYLVPAVVSYGEDAVHQAAELHPDLILMDVRLKGEMDGVEAARRIQAESDIPVVYVTASADPDILRRATSTATFGYVLKPYEERELQATIEMALAKHGMDKALRAYATRLERSNAALALVNRLMVAAIDGQERGSLLRTTCREMADILGAPYAVTMLLEQGGRTAQLMGEFVLDAQRQSLHATVEVEGTPLLQYVLARHEPWVIEDIEQDPRVSWLTRRLPKGEAFSLLVLPLMSGGEVIGGLALAVARQRGFAEEDVALGWMVATHLAVAMARVPLAEERSRLSAAIEQTAEAVIMTDLCGNIVYVNRAFERITGYTATEVLGRDARLLRSGEQAEQVYSELWATLGEGQAWQGRLVNRKKDGTLYTADVTITPVRAGDGEITHYVSVQRDITQALAREEAYRQTLKMEAVGQLATGIAHDFNNLLTAINGNASVLADGTVDGAKVREVARTILSAGKRAADLTRQLLTFTRKQVVEPRVMSLNDIVRDMHDRLERIAGAEVSLQTRLGPDLWLSNIDPVQIQRLIANLAANARDAMPQGGQLTISTANATLREASTAYDLHAGPGEYVVLSIRDTGTGMSEDVQLHLFEPFFTTKDVGQGTGLGLATVHGIVKQCNGTVQVQSTEGQGALFRVYLPRARDAKTTRELPEVRASERRGGETILLVEDDDSVFELTRRVLARRGYRLLTARDGLEAEQVAASHEGPIDLLLTDLTMPRMDGKTLAQRLTRTRPGLKVLLMSGYTGTGSGADRGSYGGMAFVQKPFRPQDLVQRVRSLLDQ